MYWLDDVTKDADLTFGDGLVNAAWAIAQAEG